MAERVCAWCRGAIDSSMRADTICCSKRCRQARHRFTTDIGTPVATGSDQPLALAYADPPYPGLSKRYYGDHPDFAGEVDHAELIERLAAFDGWALSTSARALPDVLALCPPGVRVAAWIRGERPTRSRRPLNAWEPVIYFGGRLDASLGTSAPTRLAPPASRDTTVAEDPRDASPHAAAPDRRDTSRGDRRRLDSLVHFSRPRLTDPARVVGAKPAAFCRWMFDLLGALPGDTLTDLFPGSGGILRAWTTYTERQAQ